MDPAVGELQTEKLAELRKTRKDDDVRKTLKDLKEAAEGKENLMPYILDCVKAYATLGEICDVLRDVFGEYEQAVLF